MPKVKRKSIRGKKANDTWDNSKPNTIMGQIVFGRLDIRSWWPAVVIDGSVCGKQAPKPNQEWVFWYGDGRISLVAHHNICDFRKHYIKLSKASRSKKYSVGIKDAIQNCALQDGREDVNDVDENTKWAAEGFKLPPSHQTRGGVTDFSLSEAVKSGLETIKCAIDPKEQWSEIEDLLSTNNKDEEIPGTSKSLPKKKSTSVQDSPEVDAFSDDKAGPRQVSRSFMKRMVDDERNIDEVCISCKDLDKKVKDQHPFFKGGICEDCEDNLKTYMFALDDDGFMVVCTICANTGELLLCDKAGCRRVYCITCMLEMGTKNAVQEIKKQNPWYCMLCRDFDPKTDGYLIARQDWWDNITKLFQKNICHKEIDVTNITKKRGIRVLSLFDGISTGYYALCKLGLNIDAYFAFETNQNAINVSKMNFSDKIKHLGDVEKLTHDIISKLGPLDLVIGGSPCNDLSAVNPARRGLYGHQSTGRLFFEYFRILKTIQSNSSSPLFWFYENVASMPVEYRNIITRFLNCEPNLIDAKHFSAQHRPRFYWGNIPGISSLTEVVPNGCPSLSSVITSNCMRTAVVDKLNTVTTQRNSLKPECPVMNLDEDSNVTDDTESESEPSSSGMFATPTSKKRVTVIIMTCLCKTWFMTPVASAAPYQYLNFMKNLCAYERVDAEIFRVTRWKFAGHLWYLTEEAVALALFDSSISINVKYKMVEALKNQDEMSDPDHRIHIYAQSINKWARKMRIQELFTKKTNFFSCFKIAAGFLEAKPSTWETREDKISACEFVKSLHVVNDTAERAVALMQQFNKCLSEKEDEKQYLLQVVSENCHQFKDCSMETLSKEFLLE